MLASMQVDTCITIFEEVQLHYSTAASLFQQSIEALDVVKQS